MRVNAAPVAFFVPKERRHIPPAHIWRGPGSSENQTTNETYPIREEAGFISDVLHDLENFAADPWRGTGFGVETYQVRANKLVYTLCHNLPPVHIALP